MHNEMYNTLRVILLAAIIAFAVICCSAEIEAAVEMKADAAEGPCEVTAEAEIAATAEPEEKWNSLGDFTLTAYCPCEICCGYWATVRPLNENGTPIIYTASGAIAEAGTTIAVDPNIIPRGSKIKINDHIYNAQDTGENIVGNRIDIYFENHREAIEFGVQRAAVFIAE